MDKTSFFILNVFLNSFLALFTAVILTETIIFLFRIRQGRIAALLRMVPILKLPLDLCLYDFSRWSYLQGVNPLDCEEGTRILSVTLMWTRSSVDWLILPIKSAIQFTIPGDLTFTLSDLVGHMVNPSCLKIFSISVIVLSVFLFCRKMAIWRHSIKSLNSIASHSGPATKKIRNRRLIDFYKSGKCPILASPFLKGSPFVAGILSPIIYVPSHLVECLTRREYEAVLAHELEHIRNHDVFIRLLLDGIASFFWWVPTKWLRNRIEEGQEISCDQRCSKYGIDSIDLASAICKSARYSKHHPLRTVANHLTQHQTLKRIEMLIHPPSKRFQKVKSTCVCLAVGLALSLILLGRFWMF